MTMTRFTLHPALILSVAVFIGMLSAQIIGARTKTTHIIAYVHDTEQGGDLFLLVNVESGVTMSYTINVLPDHAD